MGSPVINAFDLDSDGHCFFCLKRILVKVQQEPELFASPKFQKYSIHYLARYLKIDMGKVFNTKGQADSSLLAKVRKSRLKVELCEKCNSLNNTFSGLYLELEKLELVISSSLELIREELLGADCNPPKLFLNFSRKKEVSEIVDVLREEAIQKSEMKLDLVSPRVEIDKLTKKQIDAELSKHHTDSGIPEIGPVTEISFPKEPSKERNIEAGFESPLETLLSEDDTRNYDVDGEAMDEKYANMTEGPCGSGSTNLGNGVGNNESSLTIISAATSPSNRVGKERCSINMGTGRWKCSACPMELTSDFGIRMHYQSVHQKIRFRCIPCGKEFGNRSNYSRHHKNVHVGVKFQCLVCNKIFSRKDNLRTHQRTSGCEKGNG